MAAFSPAADALEGLAWSATAKHIWPRLLKTGSAVPPRSSHSVQINIATRHGHLSAATQAKLMAKVSRLSRYFERLAAIEVTVDLEHETTPVVDIRVDAEHKHDFVATEQSGDLWRSVDGAVQKLEQQLRKYKEKVLGRHRKPAVSPERASTAR